ncbi:MAG: hypothetical protein JKX98_08730 [Alcanivoracaceae bacterium]|nr:hypothetical protein [Alcanivoracaceae bacterium]
MKNELLIYPIKKPSEGLEDSVKEALAQHGNKHVLTQEDKDRLDVCITTDAELRW